MFVANIFAFFGEEEMTSCPFIIVGTDGHFTSIYNLVEDLPELSASKMFAFIFGLGSFCIATLCIFLNHLAAIKGFLLNGAVSVQLHCFL